MRKLKFKAWSPSKNKMSGTIDISEGVFEGLIPLQYSGLVDCKGIELYEGDLVKCVSMHDGNIDDNAWLPNGEARIFEISVSDNGRDWSFPRDLKNCPEYWEKVGNKYEGSAKC